MAQKVSSTAVRQIILVALLVAAADAAVYDFKVARPAAVRANEAIEKAGTESGSKMLKNVDIQQLLGKKPSQTIKGTNTYLEKYTWTSGLLFKNYYVWCVYTAKEPHEFQVHYLNQDVDREMQ